MTTDELLEQLTAAHATIAQQATTIEQLKAHIAELEHKLDDAQRRGKRQATPFSKGAPKAQPKKPGQKVGNRAAHRAKPERIDHILEVALPAQCSQ